MLERILRVLKSRIFLHIIFWLLYQSVWVLMDMYRGRDWDESIYRYIGCVFEIPFYYLHMYYLWPRFIANRQYVSYLFFLFLAVLMSAYLVRVYEYFVMFPMFFGTQAPAIHFKIVSVIGLVRAILQWFGPPTVIKLFRDWIANKIKLEKIEKEQKISELNFLKSQMNPHFLFNSLNNLYALSIKGSKKTPEALLQLSDLLSYTLYEGSADKVSLEKEVSHLNDYIELEKLRFGDRLSLQLGIEGDLKNVMIPPLMLIPLAENAFKHCSLSQRGKVVIHLDIKAKNNKLIVRTTNPVTAKANKAESIRQGIGSKNLSKRLELLYPNKHTFEMREQEGKYMVDLCIDLNEE